MKKIMPFARRFAGDRNGATALEYGLIASLVVIILLIGLTAVGNNTVTMWETVDTAITT